MRAQAIEHLGGGYTYRQGDQNDNNDQERQVSNNTTNNSQGFAAFRGRGQAVGGI